jgi:outer membrane immunogenic protein
MKLVYRAWLGALLLTSSLQAASAADLLVEAPAEVVADPAFSWTGFYAGVHGGYLWGDSDVELNTLSGSNFGIGAKSYDPSGGFLGAHAGYLHQFQNNVVFGFEGDVDYNWADGDLAWTGSLPSSGIDFYGDAQLKWSSSLRARLGYAFDRTLPYVTGGVSFARLDFSQGASSGDFSVFDESDARTMTGFTVGAGVSHAFTDNIIGHIEYRYTDYGSESISPSYLSQPGDSGSIDLSTQSVLAGISWKLN